MTKKIKVLQKIPSCPNLEIEVLTNDPEVLGTS